MFTQILQLRDGRSALCAAQHAWRRSGSPAVVIVAAGTVPHRAGRIVPLTAFPTPCLPGSCRITLPMFALRGAAHRRTSSRVARYRIRSYGYELVMPPLLEHLTAFDRHRRGAGSANLKLVDPAQVRSLGLRADTTQQVAPHRRPFAQSQGRDELCYCGPVLHTRPDRPHATRAPCSLVRNIRSPRHGGRYRGRPARAGILRGARA